MGDRALTEALDGSEIGHPGPDTRAKKGAGCQSGPRQEGQQEPLCHRKAPMVAAGKARGRA